MLLARPVGFEDAVLVAERTDAAIMFARGIYGGGHGGKGKGRYNPGSYQGRPSHTPMDLGAVEGNARGGGGSSGSGGRGRRPGGSKIVCYYCGKVGHIKRHCYKLNGRPQGRGGAAQVAEAGEGSKN